MICLIIFLLLCCLLEFILLLKDQGVVAFYMEAVKDIVKSKGWTSVIRPAMSVVVSKVKESFYNLKKSKYHDQCIHIAFFPRGGLGDYIISAKLLEELQSVCESRITVFCEKMEYGEAIYGGREGVELLEGDRFEKERHTYDLALMVEHFVHVKNWNVSRVKELSVELYNSINYICNNWDSLYINIRQQCWRERIQFERCSALGLDRWTELRMGKAFKIEDKNVKIPMDNAYREQVEELGITGRYITINYGADEMRKNQAQIKMWLKDYYEKFIEQIRKIEPELTIIQLGAINAERIKGADIYMLGKSIELTKWILLNSRCHVDCEGGLVHLATQLNTRCVVIFGPTPMHMYAYSQNINLYDEKCNNCMGLHEDWAYKCYREKMQCTDGMLCMKSIGPDVVCEACCKILKCDNG